MTDHWQTIEDALTFARRHSEGFWLYQNSKMRPSELVAQIDAALAFVREQRTPQTDDVREKLAEYAHEAWSGWMKYLFSKCDEETNGDPSHFPTGSEIIPEWAVKRWQRQMNTAYADLPEEEKQSDREEADKMLAIVERTPQQGRYVSVEDGEIDPIEWGIVVAYDGRVLRFLSEGGAGLSAKLPDGYRLCRWQEGDTPQPDWSTAPPEAQWWAMDINGGAYWYGAKPEMGEEGAWLTTYDTVWDDTKCPNWKDTLTQRPQPTDAAKEGETNE